MEKGKQKSESNSKTVEEWMDWATNLQQKHPDKKISFTNEDEFEKFMEKVNSLHKPIYSVVSIFDVHKLLLNLGIVMSITDINKQFVKMHQPSKREII